ncbi:hypothetical protein D0U02_14495 [Burkholderia pseudomallei]|uniref:Uncharacterized protein n=3 Tax=Burkholderia pseudomallei TaxID=28450 RepID=A0AAX0UB07_BURPE|nr:hypothetical protein [Burkholderia pseudomallei]ABN89643.1 conserved hypothetical protein [Burkholderia pseudomallei 1106a]ACQ96427.1 conserved hypothetical protein [Burkholderia pseudomallei MSHR346]EDO92609.1 conserved hypothetical protein [Burkholderia pseudomallei Pasteur 52237]EES24527.1 conserved hypothetical protein [Burkholderia pseudomallei 1106b]EET07254.1 conserved hypothetical protein [Burkholderia pseudomallei 1710a]
MAGALPGAACGVARRERAATRGMAGARRGRDVRVEAGRHAPAVFRRAVCRGMSAAWAASYVSCIPRAGHVRRIRRTHPAHPARTRATPAETKPDRKRLEPGSERFGAQTAKPLFVL